MLILGLVKWLQPVHGYELRRELISWNVDEWAALQPGSVYHALRKLTEEDLLEEVGTEQVGARPARTTYRLTPAGDAEFEDLLRRYWWDYRQPIDPFFPAFSFLPAMLPTEAAEALRNRGRMVRAEADKLRAAQQQKPVHVGWLFELIGERLAAEANWCERVANRIEAGEGYPDRDYRDSARNNQR